MIVNVELRKSGENEYGGKEYSYVTELPLSVGDIVIAPTFKGLSYARVSRVNIDPESIDPAWRDRLREICDYAPQPDEKAAERDGTDDFFGGA